MTLLRMIVPIQIISKPTRIRVTGDVGENVQMTAVRRGGGAPSPVSRVDGAWTMDLDDGDHVLSIETENWYAGRLDVEPLLTSGQSAPRFVYFGDLGSPPAPTVAAWTASVIYIDPPTSSAVGDPKDPWPPPPPPPPGSFSLDPTSETWFASTLATERSRVEAQFSSAGGKSMPADALAFAAARSAEH